MSTPAPPSLDGQMMVMDWKANGLSNAERESRKDLITTIDRPGACRFGSGCPIGLKVPVTFTGQADISLARKGRPVKTYRWRASLAAPGELLHCVDFVNKTLDEVRPLLEGHAHRPEARLLRAEGNAGLGTRILVRPRRRPGILGLGDRAGLAQQEELVRPKRTPSPRRTSASRVPGRPAASPRTRPPKTSRRKPGTSRGES